MNKKEIVTQENLFKVLDFMDRTGITYWLSGGWGVDVLVGKQTRPHRDVDIHFDSQYSDKLLKSLKEYGYEIVTDWSPSRVELYHADLGYIDIHPLVLSEDGKAKQADLEGGWFEFKADYFGYAVFQGRRISCITAKGQRIFHSGYDPRQVDKHDLKNLEELL